MAIRIPFSAEQYWDATNKNAYIGAKMYTYDSGTTTPKTTYTTAAATVSHANPIIADDNGIFPEIYGTDSYHIKIYDTDDSELIYDADEIAPTSGTAPTVTTITANGTYNVPAGTSFLKVTCIGGGGGGGGSLGTPITSGGGGGGEGETASVYIASPSSSYSVTIGAGGALGAAGAGGGTGGDTIFGSVCTAKGGFGGSQTGIGGNGGRSGTGDVLIPGAAASNASLQDPAGTIMLGGNGGGSGAGVYLVAVVANSGGGGSGGGGTVAAGPNAGLVGADGVIFVEVYS